MFVRVHRQFIVVSVFAILVVASSVQCSNSSHCTRCGRERVPFPFGFLGSGCRSRITLNCSDSKMMIGKFIVQKVTSDRILVSVPAQCNRSIEDLLPLFGSNFAPTTNNGLLLENCSLPVNDCLIPRRFLIEGFGIENCTGPTMNIPPQKRGCYSGDSDRSTEFLNFNEARGHCSFLSSSVMVEMNRTTNIVNANTSALLKFQMLELQWWVDTYFTCDPYANMTTVVHEGKKGVRCKCKEGYTGDGFANITGGIGCQKVQELKAGLIGGIIAGVVTLLIGLGAVCFCIRRRTIVPKSLLSAKRLINEVAGNSSVPFYTYKDIERATNGFSEKQRLGNGAYGTVYAGKLHNDEWVAIKKIRYRDHESAEQVMNEIKLLSAVSHPNLVRLLGCCIENGEQILVYEYMPYGTLSQHLQREKGTTLPWTVRLTIAAETAHAIAHLHSADPPIYHRDIKSSNILLDNSYKSKVADFGLSRFGMTDDSHVSTAPQGTPGYVDPQYHQNFHLSDKSDVYSFGVVLVEIITAMKVVDFSRPHSEINLAALATDRIGKGRIDEIIDPFLEPNRDAWTLSSIHKMAELAFRCLAFHRDMRPSMMEVADELEQIRVTGWAPMDDTIHMGSSVVSYCSSPYQGSEKSVNIVTSKRTVVGSRRVIVPQRAGTADIPITEEIRDTSPVSVQDSWQSEQSSPSSNSLLGKVK